jgi:predicted enzyme related to lactoylglutathione lyase
MPPTFGNGKICYIEIPAIDITRSADFYASVFGWDVRRRGDGSTAFDDGVGEVSGTWVERPPHSNPSLLVHIMVDDMTATIASVLAHGGQIVQQVGADAPEITAKFRDPAGNIFGLYQHRGSTAIESSTVAG